MNFVPDLSWDICVFHDHPIADVQGTKLIPTCAPVSLEAYDVLILPGGLGTRKLKDDPEFVRWIQTAGSVPLKTSVCTGSLLLGAAGFLRGKRATTHFSEYETLRNYGAVVVRETVVDDGDLITAGAVSASFQLGLYLCEKWAGEDARQKISASMGLKGSLEI